MAEVALGLARAAEAMEGEVVGWDVELVETEGEVVEMAGQVAEIEMEVVTDTMEAEAVETATEVAWKGVAALGARQEAE